MSRKRAGRKRWLDPVQDLTAARPHWEGRGICLNCHNSFAVVKAILPGEAMPPYPMECPECGGLTLMGVDTYRWNPDAEE